MSTECILLFLQLDYKVSCLVQYVLYRTQQTCCVLWFLPFENFNEIREEMFQSISVNVDFPPTINELTPIVGNISYPYLFIDM